MKRQFGYAWLAIVLVGLSPGTSWAQTKVIATRGNIQSLSLEQLKILGWPAGDGPRIVGRGVVMTGIMWPPLTPPQVELLEAPAPVGRRLCRRISHQLPLQWQDQDLFYSQLNSGLGASINDDSVLKISQTPRRIVGLTFAPNCRTANDQRYAQISPSYEFEAIAALQMLDAVQQRAKRRQTLGLSMQCSTRSGPNRCASAHQKSLADLPIHQVWNIRQG